jgi:hypothetical protein
VFAVLKVHAKKLFHDRISQNPFIRSGKHDAVADLIAARDFMGPSIIQEGWEMSMP